MQSNQILETVTLVAVTLTGFTGVVAALGQRGSGRWSSEEVLQFRTLVEPSLIALFGAFLPGMLELIVQPEELLWRISNGTLSLLSLAGVAAFVLRSRSASTTAVQRLFVVLGVVAIGLQLLAAGGVLASAELIFVVSLVFALVVAAYNFLLLLVPVGHDA